MAVNISVQNLTNRTNDMGDSGDEPAVLADD